jgi:predicted nucleotidyltransferase
VILFGSLSAKRAFTRWSDIDLAAWGIPPEQFYAAVAMVTGLSAEFKLDLVDPQSCQPSLRAAIEQGGVEV